MFSSSTNSFIFLLANVEGFVGVEGKSSPDHNDKPKPNIAIAFAVDRCMALFTSNDVILSTSI